MNQRVYVITGARGALGSAIVELAAERQLAVAAIGTATGWTDARAGLCIGGVDLRKESDAVSAMDQVAAKFGRIDALLNVAGGFAYAEASEAKETLWADMFALNCQTAINASKAALPHLRKSDAGRIVNVGAASAISSSAGMGPYAASKSALHRFTESLAAELASTSITVNAVLPSIIDTPANRAAMKSAKHDTWVRPRDLAEVMLFLASPAAGAITRALIPVIGRVI